MIWGYHYFRKHPNQQDKFGSTLKPGETTRLPCGSSVALKDTERHGWLRVFRFSPTVVPDLRVQRQSYRFLCNQKGSFFCYMLSFKKWCFAFLFPPKSFFAKNIPKLFLTHSCIAWIESVNEASMRTLARGRLLGNRIFNWIALNFNVRWGNLALKAAIRDRGGRDDPFLRHCHWLTSGGFPPFLWKIISFPEN